MDTEVIVPQGLNRMGQLVTTQSESCSAAQAVWGANIAALVSCQGSNAACSLALKPDGVIASRRHSPSYDSSSRLASGLDGGAIKRHLSLDTTLGPNQPLEPS
jgi:hypothetical protein